MHIDCFLRFKLRSRSIQACKIAGRDAKFTSDDGDSSSSSEAYSSYDSDEDSKATETPKPSEKLEVSVTKVAKTPKKSSGRANQKPEGKAKARLPPKPSGKQIILRRDIPIAFWLFAYFYACIHEVFGAKTSNQPVLSACVISSVRICRIVFAVLQELPMILNGKLEILEGVSKKLGLISGPSLRLLHLGNQARCSASKAPPSSQHSQR
jgi:hypothetical protein